MWDATRIVLFVAVIFCTSVLGIMGTWTSAISYGLVFATGLSAMIDHAQNTANEDGYHLAA